MDLASVTDKPSRYSLAPESEVSTTVNAIPGAVHIFQINTVTIYTCKTTTV